MVRPAALDRPGLLPAGGWPTGGNGERLVIDDLFAARGVQRTVSLEVVDVATALRMAGARLGIAFVPEEFVTDDTGLVRVDLRDPPPATRLGLGMALDRPVSTATRALRRTILARRGPPATVD